MQWGGSHVWKIGGKVFAIANSRDTGFAVTFKAGEPSYEILKMQPGLRPAPYLASRGLKWIQHYAEPGLSDDELKAYLHRSYLLAASGLPRRAQVALGLLTPKSI